MTQDSTRSIALSAKRFFTGTLVSRFTGLGREVLMAAAFGTVPAVAAFWMAFRFANLLRRLFGEGGLNAAFIPHFEHLRKNDPQKAALFFYQLSWGLIFLLVIITGIGEVVLGSLLWFGNLTASTAEVMRLTMLMLPSLVFICSYALNSALLNCEKTYFVPSVAPAFLNIVWLVAVIVLWKLPAADAMYWLAMTIVFAFAAQWFVTVPLTYRYLARDLGVSQKPPGKFGKEIYALIRPFLYGLIGVTATQINSALDTIFARSADSEGPAYLWYALRVEQLPLALFGIALTGVLLPPIARAIGEGNREKYQEFMQFALKRMSACMIPITFALGAVGLASINLVYGHGQFGEKATFETTRCLLGYSLGLLPMNIVLILASAFYAQKNYKYPTMAALTTIVLSCGLNALFIYGFGWGALSVSISTSIAAFVNMFLLFFTLPNAKGLVNRRVLLSLLKVLLASSVAFAVTLLFGHTILHEGSFALLLGEMTVSSRLLTNQLFVFASLSSVFGLTLLATSWLLKAEDILALIPYKYKKA